MNKKLVTSFMVSMFLLSLTACFGGGDDTAEETPAEEVAAEEMSESMGSGEEESVDEEDAPVNVLTDDEFLETTRELVDLVAELETMDGEEAFASMTRLLELSTMLDGFDDERALKLLDENPELKAAIEAVGEMK